MKYSQEDFIQADARIDLIIRNLAKQRLYRLSLIQHAGHFLRLLPIRINRPGGQPLNDHIRGCAEHDDPIDLETKLPHIASAAAQEQKVGVCGRQELLNAVLPPYPIPLRFYQRPAINSSPVTATYTENASQSKSTAL